MMMKNEHCLLQWNIFPIVDFTLPIRLMEMMPTKQISLMNQKETSKFLTV